MIRTEGAREVADGHAGPVDVALVVGEEHVHVRVVADEGHVEGAPLREGAREQLLLRAPAVGVGGVTRGAVGEAVGPTPVVGEHPEVLRGEVEQRRRDAIEGNRVLGGGGHVGPVREGAEGRQSPAPVVTGEGVVRRGIDDVLAVVDDAGEVLERGPPRLRLRQRAGRCPAVRRRKSTRVARPGHAGPLLVGAALARPEPRLRAVGLAPARGFQAQPGPHADDRAVGVHPPLLVVSAGTRPDLHRGPGRGAAAPGIQALVAVHGQLAAVRQRPLLVDSTVAVPDVHVRAVGLAEALHIETAAGINTAHVAGGGRLSRAGDEQRRQRGQGRDHGGEHHGRTSAAETTSAHKDLVILEQATPVQPVRGCPGAVWCDPDCPIYRTRVEGSSNWMIRVPVISVNTSRKIRGQKRSQAETRRLQVPWL